MATFRDVTILHGEDGSEWAEYIQRKIFKIPNHEMSVHMVDVSGLPYIKPPEIEISVRESYVVVFLVTYDLLNYLEYHHNWLCDMLEKCRSDYTTIVWTTLDIGEQDLLAVCQEINDLVSQSLAEIESDGSNINDIVEFILRIVEPNKNRHTIDTPHSRACQMFPDKIKMNDDEIVIVFEDEIEGQVTLVFNDSSDPVSTTTLNPFCVTFIPPVLPPGQHEVHVLLNEKEIDVLDLLYCNFEITSIDFMKQCLGVTTDDELDEALCLQYQESNCMDETLNQLTNAAQKEPGSQSKSFYPTALHWAAGNGLKKLTSKLLLLPCSLQTCNILNSMGWTVPYLAERSGHIELQKIIEDYILQCQESKLCGDFYDELYVQPDTNNEILTSSQDPYLTMSDGSALPPSVLPRPRERIYSALPRREHPMKNRPAPELPTGRPSEPPQAPELPTRRTSTPSQAPELPTRKTSNPPQAPELPNRTPSEPSQAPEIPTRTPSNPPQPITLKEGAVGCRSQNELIDIGQGFRDKKFTEDEAIMLFKAWTLRNQSGKSSMSFMNKQKSLHALQEKYNTLSLLPKGILPTTMEEGATPCLNISDPIIKRKVEVGPKDRRLQDRSSGSSRSSRGTNSGVSMRRSADSGCDMRADFAIYDESVDESPQASLLVRQYRTSIIQNSENDDQKPPPLPSRSSKKRVKDKIKS